MHIVLALGLVLAAYIRIIRCQNQTVGNVPDGTLVCFSCRGVTHLKYCNVVERCTENVGCYVEQYFIGSHPRYNSGCMTPNMTCDMMHQQQGNCTTCCSTSLCNSHGCGDSGFGSQGSRGPLCYECEHLGNPADCVTIQQCASGQVCHIAEFPWGDNDSLFSMGCNSKAQCNSPASSLWTPDHAIIGRSAPTCSRCCEQDFCNLNCAAHPVSPSKTTPIKLTTNVATTRPPSTRFNGTHSTTRRSPVTLPPVPRICSTCGANPIELCEFQFEDTQCDPPNNYCMNVVTNVLTGTMTVERKCVAFDECYSSWWQGSSDEEICQSFTPDRSLTATFQCSFCCIEDSCNRDIKPSSATLYRNN